MDKGLKSTCAGCGKLIDDGENYASIGGNIVPYMPAKAYHIVCVPSIKVEPYMDIYAFQLCEVCMPADPIPATFVVNIGGINHYYCEEHGTALDLSRGIPVNHAEPETRCKDCQTPLEEGHICDDCSPGMVED